MASLSTSIRNKKNIFLLDSFGALVSALLLGVVLVNFESIFGMPSKVLKVLSFIACGFALFSIACFFFVSESWRTFLRMISIANTMYCVITFVLVCYFYNELTIYGLLYFIGEITIVMSLVRLEWKTSMI